MFTSPLLMNTEFKKNPEYKLKMHAKIKRKTNMLPSEFSNLLKACLSSAQRHSSFT